MYNSDTDLLFPPRLIPSISRLRGEVWQDLVQCVISAGPESPEWMAFILMMAHLNNCSSCNADSYRAICGCTSCSAQSLNRFHDDDIALTNLFQAAKCEAVKFLSEKTLHGNNDPAISIETIHK